MSKRRATEELYTGDNRKAGLVAVQRSSSGMPGNVDVDIADQPGATAGYLIPWFLSLQRHDASPERAVEFTAHLRALNSQFAQWVQEQAGSNSDLLWVDGAKDYVQFAEKLLEEYEDLIKAGKSRSSPARGNNLFSTPGPAAAFAGNSNAHTNRSTGATVGGRKSVSFAATPTFSASADGPAASTPGPANLVNTANAGHTPAPASGLSFTFGVTPGPSNAGTKALPSPEPIKWGSTIAATDAREAEPSSSAAAAQSGAAPASGFTFGISPPNTTPSPPPATAAAPAPAAATKAFAFGISTSSTPAADSNGPAAAAGSTPAASPLPSSTGGFTFGATPSVGNGTTPGEGATSSTPASTFTFGALPSTTAAAAGPSSTTPTFSFGAGAAGTTGVGFFNFPAPSAAAAGDAGGEGEGAEEEPPQKYNPEITVDESTWNVFFNTKARLHVRRAQAGKSDWDSKGVGVLTVRQRKDGSDSSTYVTFTNDGGKQLVSSRLQKNTDVRIVPEQPKKCRISLTVISYELPPARKSEASNAAASTEPKYSVEVCMISLSSAEKMLELQQAVNEHKPK